MTQAIQQTEQVFVRNDEVKSNVPSGWIPLEEVGMRPPSKDSDVFDMRTNNEHFLFVLWKNLAGKTYARRDGKDYLAPIKGVTPPLSYEGATEIINMLRFLNNPSVILGNISYEEAVVERDHILEALADRFAQEKEFFQVNNTERKSIMAQLTPLIWHQLSRAINGFESKNLITQISEERGDHKVSQEQKAQNNGWFGRKS